MSIFKKDEKTEKLEEPEKPKFANGGIVSGDGQIKASDEFLLNADQKDVIEKIVDLLPCNNRECKHTFATVEAKEYAVKVGCPKCGI